MPKCEKDGSGRLVAQNYATRPYSLYLCQNQQLCPNQVRTAGYNQYSCQHLQHQLHQHVSVGLQGRVRLQPPPLPKTRTHAPWPAQPLYESQCMQVSCRIQTTWHHDSILPCVTQDQLVPNSLYCLTPCTPCTLKVVLSIRSRDQQQQQTPTPFMSMDVFERSAFARNAVVEALKHSVAWGQLSDDVLHRIVKAGSHCHSCLANLFVLQQNSQACRTI